MLSDLSRAHLRTLVLIQFYEKLRAKQSGNRAYRVFHKPLLEITQQDVESKGFKQFATVRKWLEDGGWEIRRSTLHWQGYIKFVFEKFAPDAPMPGQLRNKRLLQQYISCDVQEPPKGRGREELARIYYKAMRPEFRDNVELMRRLRLTADSMPPEMDP